MIHELPELPELVPGFSAGRTIKIAFKDYGDFRYLEAEAPEDSVTDVDDALSAVYGRPGPFWVNTRRILVVATDSPDPPTHEMEDAAMKSPDLHCVRTSSRIGAATVGRGMWFMLVIPPNEPTHADTLADGSVWAAMKSLAGLLRHNVAAASSPEQLDFARQGALQNKED